MPTPEEHPHDQAVTAVLQLLIEAAKNGNTAAVKELSEAYATLRSV